MLDFAELVVINKFDRKGADDALRDVRKQVQRNREAFDRRAEEMPVYGTIASRFNDDGVTALYHGLKRALREHGLIDWPAGRLPEPAARVSSRAHAIVPTERVRYLAEIVENEVGPTVRYLGLEMTGDPGWAYAEDGPFIDGEARLRISWEPGAGRVKPKPRPRPRPAAPVEEIVEADLSRPIRAYALHESFSAGDRIDHPKLGLGVVQAIAGPRKIRVRFEEKDSILVHER